MVRRCKVDETLMNASGTVACKQSTEPSAEVSGAAQWSLARPSGCEAFERPVAAQDIKVLH